MPIVLIGIVVVLAVIVAGFCFFESEYHIASIFSLIAIALGVWMILAYGQPRETLSDEVFSTQMIEHTDGSSITIIIVDGNVVNLTKEMGLSFPPDTKIRRIITSQCGGGIWWMNGKHTYNSTDKSGVGLGLVSYSVVTEEPNGH
jgi:hypothetical protein